MTTREGDYLRWVGHLGVLGASVRYLEPLCDDLGVPSPGKEDWHGALFGHLLPQLDRDDPILLVAIAGGTNTGKSTIFNQLAGAAVSRTERFATRTKHPVCVLPRGDLRREDVERLFPGFEIHDWQSEDDATRDCPEDLLFVTRDREGHQSPRLVLIDTPDIDGTLPENWRRADRVRNAADVLVCVLTEQKYNDDAVVKFFRHAGHADKTLIVVFNFVEWPEDREICQGWLATFGEMTQAAPHYVYAAERDRQAAAEFRLPFHALSPGAEGLRRDLSELKFTEIKLRSCRGSLRTLLDQDDGIPRFLSRVRRQAGEFSQARDTLVQDVAVRDVELPRVPAHIIWEPVWRWLKPRRTTFDIWVHGFYHQAGRLITTPFRGSDKTLEDKFRKAEWDSYSRAVQLMLDKLRLLRKSGNTIIKEASSRVLRGAELEQLFLDLKRAYDDLPLVSDDYCRYVDQTLEEYARHNPKVLKLITGGLLAGAVVRPALTVGLACIPGAEFLAFSAQSAATEVAAQAAAEAASQAAQHTIATVGVDVAAAVGGNVAVEAAGQWSLTELLRGLFRGFYRLRAEKLMTLVHQETTKPVIDRLDVLANVANSPHLERAEAALRNLRAELATQYA